MSGEENRADAELSKKVHHSKALLISEYKNETAAEHVIGFLSKETKLKPNMKHIKSDVLQRVKALLPAFEQAEKELQSKDDADYNIEEVEEGGPVIEMDVAIIKKSETESSHSEDESESFESEDESETSESEYETDSSSSELKCEGFEEFRNVSNLNNLCSLKSTDHARSKHDSELNLLQTPFSKKKKHSNVPLIVEIGNSSEDISSNKET